jgi:hypothetical protein
LTVARRCNEADLVLFSPCKLNVGKEWLEIPTRLEAETGKDGIHDPIDLARNDEVIATAQLKEGFINCDL